MKKTTHANSTSQYNQKKSDVVTWNPNKGKRYHINQVLKSGNTNTKKASMILQIIQNKP